MSDQARPTIGVLMIVKNEQEHLRSCLSSVCDWVDEIVLVDSGSSDNTESIAREFTSHFYRHEDWQGFGVQRQRAQSYMQSDWVLALDADEVVSPELKDSVLEAISQSSKDSVYRVNRLTQIFGRYIRHSGWYPDWIVRLYPRELTQYNDALVHESVDVPAGTLVRPLTGDLLHNTCTTLPEYTAKTSGYMKAWADQREGKKRVGMSSAVIHGLGRFFKMYVLKRGFLDGRHGFLLACLSANTTFTRYADLWLRSSKYTKSNESK